MFPDGVNHKDQDYRNGHEPVKDFPGPIVFGSIALKGSGNPVNAYDQGNSQEINRQGTFQCHHFLTVHRFFSMGPPEVHP